MVDVEPLIRDELDRLSPRRDEQSDWADVVRRAGRATGSAKGASGANARADSANRVFPAARRRRRIFVRLATTVAVALSALGVLAAISSRQGGATLVEQALAAVGDGPVLHVVIAPPTEHAPLIAIESGETIPREQRMEVWFDENRDLMKQVTTLDGQVLDEMLMTAEGGFTRTGPVITCAWIAAHPVEATKLRVSCNASGENGTTPRQVPEQPPSLDEALAGFVDGYADALASGRAEQVGEGRVDGRDVVWLEIRVPAAGGGPARVDRVALDTDTNKPVLVTGAEGAVRFKVLAIETIDFSPALFTKPEPDVVSDGGVGGSTKSLTPVSAAAAARALGGTALWLGESWGDYELIEVREAELSIGFGPLSGRDPITVTGVEFEYGRRDDDGRVQRDSVFTLRETTTCTVHWGWTCSPRDPTKPGTMATELITRIRAEGLYVALWGNRFLLGNDNTAALEIARALRQVPTTN